jgi:hypothetical protein
MTAGETKPVEPTDGEVRLLASLIEQTAASNDGQALGRLYLEMRTIYGSGIERLLARMVDLLDRDRSAPE